MSAFSRRRWAISANCPPTISLDKRDGQGIVCLCAVDVSGAPRFRRRCAIANLSAAAVPFERRRRPAMIGRNAKSDGGRIARCTAFAPGGVRSSAFRTELRGRTRSTHPAVYPACSLVAPGFPCGGVGWGRNAPSGGVYTRRMAAARADTGRKHPVWASLSAGAGQRLAGCRPDTPG